ncbi:MAG: DUF3251 domain-containing protein [Candidatus Omnitrophica bacterium]|nr:DUF3251 domain-containing protein [Candidatus Omnitrophota bacterium]
MNWFLKITLTGLLLVSGQFFPVYAQGQNDSADVVNMSQIHKLDSKITRLEDYLKQIEPAFNNFSSDLDEHLKMRIEKAVGNLVYLDPLSKDFHKIATNAGSFLIAIKEINKLEKGYLMKVRVGNPNNASYEGIKLTISWGKPWDPKSVRKNFQDWRRSLLTAKYNYSGSLESGTWTEIAVELTPIQLGHWGHLECSMDIKTIKLQKKRRN